MRSILVVLCFLILSACAPRGFMSYSAPEQAGAAVLKRVYSISNRQFDPNFAGGGSYNDGTPKSKNLYSQNLSGKRADDMNFTRLDISLPPSHQLGEIEWPKWQEANVEKHFAVRHEETFNSAEGFLGSLRAEPANGEVVLFVHGYNVNLSEAVYRMAQLSNDYELDMPVISFSWPSAANAAGYIYDRDSVVFSRDALENILKALVRDGHKIALVGHSMGSQLIMETLRQMSIAGDTAVLHNLARVILMSPDIDEDVFLAQSERIDPFPKNFVLLVSRQDRALGLASMITGRPNRLGSIESPDVLRHLPITIIDMSHVRGGDALGHSKALTAPRAIAQLTGLTQLTGQAESQRAYEESNISLCVAVRGPELCLQQVAQ